MEVQEILQLISKHINWLWYELLKSNSHETKNIEKGIQANFSNNNLENLDFSKIIYENLAFVYFEEISYFNDGELIPLSREKVLSKVDFSKCKIMNCDFSDLRFFKTSFQNSKISNCCFDGATFENIDFNALFENSTFRKVKFKNSKIQYFNINKFEDCVFEDCIIPDIGTYKDNQHKEQNNSFKNCKFLNCIIGNISLRGEIEGLSFINCKCEKQATISCTNIFNCSFVGLKKIQLINCNGSDLNFHKSKIEKIDSCNFSNCNFTECIVKGGSIKSTKLIRCDFSFSFLVNCIISNSELECSSFYKADLSASYILKNCKLLDVDFTEITIDEPCYQIQNNISFYQFRSNYPGFENLTYCLETKMIYFEWSESGGGNYFEYGIPNDDNSLNQLRYDIDGNEILYPRGSGDFGIYSQTIDMKLSKQKNNKSTIKLSLIEFQEMVIYYFINSNIMNHVNIKLFTNGFDKPDPYGLLSDEIMIKFDEKYYAKIGIYYLHICEIIQKIELEFKSKTI